MADCVASLWFDGASRGNPGLASAGAVLRSGEGKGELLARVGYLFPEPVSNNVAEYQGLIIGLETARAIGVTHLSVFGDSKLIIDQMNRVNAVRHPAMVRANREARALCGAFTTLSFAHVYRDFNTEADAITNDVLDNRRGFRDVAAEGTTLRAHVFTPAAAPAARSERLAADLSLIQAALVYAIATARDAHSAKHLAPLFRAASGATTTDEFQARMLALLRRFEAHNELRSAILEAERSR